jgi:hypothetical protein
MNEQLIREIANQSSEYAEQTVHYYNGQFDGLTWEAKILKTRDLKFAELIVQECSLTAAMFSIDKNDFHPAIKWVKWDDMSESAKTINHTTCQQVAAKIKKHFGVSE